MEKKGFTKNQLHPQMWRKRDKWETSEGRHQDTRDYQENTNNNNNFCWVGETVERQSSKA